MYRQASGAHCCDDPKRKRDLSLSCRCVGAPTQGQLAGRVLTRRAHHRQRDGRSTAAAAAAAEALKHPAPERAYSAQR